MSDNELELYCLNILENSGQPERVINHCKAVANTAKKLATDLNKKGFDLDVSLCYRAGLLHDVCRTEKRHAEKGKEYLEGLGLFREAEIVAVHMGEEINTEEITEAGIVCLADKLTAGGNTVSIKKRFEPAFKKYAGDAETLALINQRYETAVKLESLVNKYLASGS
ncbi:MAG: HD domain-containing protein [Clostridiales bacterium]|nr:HD domain-containing protein [Clostridiales bacterium]